MQVSTHCIHINRLTEFCQDIFLGVLVAILGHLFKSFEGFFGQLWKQRVSQAQLTVNLLPQHSLQEGRGLGHGCLGPKHMRNRVISTWVTYRRYVYNINTILLKKKGGTNPDTYRGTLEEGPSSGLSGSIFLLAEDSIVSRTVTAKRIHGKEQSVSLSAIMSGGARGSNEYYSDYTALHR